MSIEKLLKDMRGDGPQMDPESDHISIKLPPQHQDLKRWACKFARSRDQSLSTVVRAAILHFKRSVEGE